jgi:hypothetical protein
MNICLYLCSLIVALTCTIPIHAVEMFWPALHIGIAVGIAVFTSFFLVIISVIVEGVMLYLWLPHVSYLRALLISCAGNMASFYAGTFLMMIVSVAWQMIFNIYPVGTVENYIISWVLMYVGSSFIELMVIKAFFNYTFKNLLVPVLIGNLITYGFVLYQYLFATVQSTV